MTDFIKYYNINYSCLSIKNIFRINYTVLRKFIHIIIYCNINSDYFSPYYEKTDKFY